MTDKEHMDYCKERIKMFVEMMKRSYPDCRNCKKIKGE